MAAIVENTRYDTYGSSEDQYKHGDLTKAVTSPLPDTGKDILSTRVHKAIPVVVKALGIVLIAAIVYKMLKSKKSE